MTSNSRISKLSTQVKDYFSVLKRRKHHSHSTLDSDGGTIAVGEQHRQGSLDIVHLSMEESKGCQVQQVDTGYVQVPMNYWLTNTDDEGEEDEEHEDGMAGGLPSFARVQTNERESDAYVPLRVPLPVPQPAPIHIPSQKPFPIPGRGNNSVHAARFSQDEWQEKAGEALFGSLRSRSKLTGSGHPEAGRNKRGREQGVEDEDADGPSDDATFNGWTEKASNAKSPRISTLGSTRMDPIQSFLDLSSAEPSPTQASPYDQCINALNELLFATNARVESELHGLPQCYMDGRDVQTRFTSDFNTIVSHAYDDFVPAAQTVLSTVSQMTHNRQRKQPGPMESLLAEIVARYADETASVQARRHYDDYAIYSSEDLRTQVEALGVGFVKYSKEQMTMYATTSISKYVSSQVLLSTGIENDLEDKLESCTQALDVITGQIDVLDSQAGSEGRDDCRDSEVTKLRSKASKWEAQIRQLQADVADASHIRKTFELVLLQVQAL
ncbi:hypothetical protein EV175_001437 [Coemansia sp. RSA 1933]|nr:hypothetical protein EV175_001437 [Coemansia sp. RSA 1933]